jgi:hypothetical protein
MFQHSLVDGICECYPSNCFQGCNEFVAYSCDDCTATADQETGDATYATCEVCAIVRCEDCYIAACCRDRQEWWIHR